MPTAAQASALPLHVLQGDIKSTLDSSMFGNLLLGIYTMIYIGTIYICLSRKTLSQAQPRTVVISLTLLYLFCLGDSTLHWYLLDIYFVRTDTSRVSIFLSLLVPPGWAHLTDNIFTFATVILADGLMIWRCFYVWNRRLLVIAVPIFLFIVETGVFLTSIIYISVVKAKPNRLQGLTIDNIESAGYFLSAGTSLLATALIAYRIHSMAQGSSIRRLSNVLEIVVQSALVYSFALLLQGIAFATPFNYINTDIYALGKYAKVLLTYISGIAPTVMVARVCLSADSTTEMSTFPQVSNIKFVKPDCIPTQSQVTETRVDNSSETGLSQGEKTFDQV